MREDARAREIQIVKGVIKAMHGEHTTHTL